ncbi:hypothetical protein BDY19DRAFT_966653, partial [Irpex rosettiformis]
MCSPTFIQKAESSTVPLSLIISHPRHSPSRAHPLPMPMSAPFEQMRRALEGTNEHVHRSSIGARGSDTSG